MLSTFVKHLWLIQPGEPPPPVLPIDAAGGRTIRFAPAWDLLCLQAFILDRTGYTCSLVDIRLHDSIAKAFAEGGAGHATTPFANMMAVIYTTTQHLGPVADVIRYLRTEHPDMAITLFGPHVNAYPESLDQLPKVDFGLRGDPEQILRHLLDALDVPHRQRLIPGLIRPGEPSKPPHWMKDLRGLSLPDWQTAHWQDYFQDSGMRGAHVEARLSRGHPGTPADQPWGGKDEPLRVWAMDRMARTLQKCRGQAIEEVFFQDPPGFWSDETLKAWLDELRYLRNTQPWAFQLIARDLPDALIPELALQGCLRVELIIPLLPTPQQGSLGYTLTDPQLGDLINRLRASAVDPQLIFWIEGPWPCPDETAQILDKVKQFGRPPFAVYPFPYHLDAPLLAHPSIASATTRPPGLEDWIHWAREPGTPPPLPLWTGSAGAHRATATLQTLQRRIARDPWRILHRWTPESAHALRESLEELAQDTLGRLLKRFKP